MTAVPVFLEGLLDDAATFPPGNAPLPDAVREHRVWRQSAAATIVGPFICAAPKLDELAALDSDFPISVTVPDGAQALAPVLQDGRFEIVSIEVPLNGDGWHELVAAARQTSVYAEVPLDALTAELSERLLAGGLRLKLRTGGTEASRFPTSAALATGLFVVVRAGLPFKLTAGLHNALRHRDPDTGFEHHGFLNVLVAVAQARRGGGIDDIAAILELQQADRVAEQVREMANGDLVAARELFTSFGTCSITEPLDDLVALDLLPSCLMPAVNGDRT